jgi:hypothetical protein
MTDSGGGLFRAVILMTYSANTDDLARQAAGSLIASCGEPILVIFQSRGLPNSTASST